MNTAPQSELTRPSLVLGEDELREITGGFKRAADQLKVLHDRGFYRAAMIRGILVLERSHYDAVTRARQEDLVPKRLMLKSQRLKAA